MMPGFVSERVFQLQNGLQEVVLCRADPVVEEPPAGAVEGDTPLAPPPRAD
jgi:hypothetical protein